MRIEQEIWEDQAPEGPEASLQDSDATNEEARRKQKSPYKLVASMQQAGLGLLTWWE